ncbi:vacuolar ATPase assembly integral membrane protein vma21-like [Acanthaster planci]|uniref:Vacuolar ATPase assembly integral membrane protein vma21-like n=1 Tax=Acanthaster planci TaxID=133434 RepID=A0A8B7XH70_ACAPL|nr:vacuolar ATPase assembly integral membrane protein vma21-like [Acanthaster planci]
MADKSDVAVHRIGGPSTMSPFKTVFLYSGVMLFFPVFMYFFSKAFIFDGLFDMKGSDSIFYAAMTAVVTVHIVLAMFLWAAFKETPQAPPIREVKRE